MEAGSSLENIGPAHRLLYERITKINERFAVGVVSHLVKDLLI